MINVFVYSTLTPQYLPPSWFLFSLHHPLWGSVFLLIWEQFHTQGYPCSMCCTYTGCRKWFCRRIYVYNKKPKIAEIKWRPLCFKNLFTQMDPDSWVVSYGQPKMSFKNASKYLIYIFWYIKVQRFFYILGFREEQHSSCLKPIIEF